MRTLKRLTGRAVAAAGSALTLLLLLVPGAGTAAAVDAPGAAGLAAAASAPCAVVQAGNRADTYWIAHGPGQAAGKWQNATFNVANLHLVALTGAANHYSLPWAQKLRWGLGTTRNAFFPDNFAVGEAYIAISHLHTGGGVNLGPLRSRVASLVSGGHTGVENYVDSLNMNLPGVAQLGVMDGSQADLAFVHSAYTFAEKTHGLYNPSVGLWWRDGSFVGSNTYWSRGNGWAMMATAKLLADLPASDPLRPELVKVLQAMAAELKKIQRSDGAWPADLLNPGHVPGPEESGTGFFTFAIAWGINNGVLDGATYRPVVQSAWRWLSGTALHANGVVGFVQPEGSAPAPTTSTTTRAYGAGAFILAATEVARQTPGC
jgi:unsaturated rhamnogalacturonyl hydrolase